MEFKIEQERIYAEDAEGRMIAEVTFPVRCGTAVIDHTFVDDSLRGQGVAGKLMQLAVDKILADGNKIGATCPYAVLWLHRHPQYKVEETDGQISCRLNP